MASDSDGPRAVDDGDSLASLEARLEHRFARRDLLVRALTHSSYANECNQTCEDNEALEFLGDAVLTFHVADRLHQAFPHLDEGRLSRHKHLLTCRTTLAEVSRELGLQDHLRLGRGEIKSGGPNQRILANLFEAIIAAVHLDAGLDAARVLIQRALATRFAGLDPENPVMDWKSAFQEFAEREGLGTPFYRLIETTGPDHARLFRVAACVGGRDVAEGSGSSKRAAHQAAARRAHAELDAILRERAGAASGGDGSAAADPAGADGA